MIFEKIHVDAIKPTKVNKFDAGFDIYTPVDLFLESSDLIKVPLGFRLQLPINTAGILMGRSGLGVKGIDPLEFYDPVILRVLGGLVDCNYIGEWGIILKNLGAMRVALSRGDRVAQFIVVVLSKHNEIVDGKCVARDGRGESGFGSSGSS